MKHTLSNYPPGESGAAVRWTATYRCPDPACKARWEVTGVTELGAYYLDRDEDADCPECGQPGKPV